MLWKHLLGGEGWQSRTGKKADPGGSQIGHKWDIYLHNHFFFLFLETFSETWSLTESGFFASDPSLTLNANQWFAVVGILLSNSVASTSTFANDTPDSVQPCSPQNISLLAKAAQWYQTRSVLPESSTLSSFGVLSAYKPNATICSSKLETLESSVYRKGWPLLLIHCPLSHRGYQAQFYSNFQCVSSQFLPLHIGLHCSGAHPPCMKLWW